MLNNCYVKNKSKKTANRRVRSNLRNNQLVRNPEVNYLRDTDSYTGQQHSMLTMPMTPIIFSPTAGTIAGVLPITIGGIQAFATRFGSTYDEYRILKALVRIRCLSSGVAGVTKFWFDEKSSATPTLTAAQERYTITLVNNNANSRSFTTLSWVARDLLDLEFSAIVTSTIPVWFCCYTDSTNFGNNQATGGLWLVEPMVTLEFRGLKST